MEVKDLFTVDVESTTASVHTACIFVVPEILLAAIYEENIFCVS